MFITQTTNGILMHKTQGTGHVFSIYQILIPNWNQTFPKGDLKI